MKYSELYRVLRQAGLKQEDGGNHYLFVKKDGKKVAVPRHPAHEVPKGILNAILKQAGLK